MLEVRMHSPKHRQAESRGHAVDAAATREARDAIERVRAGENIFPLRTIPATAAAEARRRVPEEFLAALTVARVNIRRFHECQRRADIVHEDGDGVRLTRRVRPLGRAGILCDSFMSLLMHAVPAQIAGVREIAVVVAPGAAAASGEAGAADPRILATAKSLGLDELYLGGGAEAVAALAFGAAPLPRRADKIVGPGSAAATAAKRELAHLVGTDGDRGLGELLVIADAGANARFIACDLLAQAEHGGSLVLLTDDRMLAEAVRIEVGRLAEALPNRDALAAALEARGAIRLVRDIDAAVDAANALAPARLSLQTRDNARYLPDIDTAGAVFVGPWAAEAVGDYFSGLNSFLPVCGAAGFASGLGVDDFVREIAVVEYGAERLAATGRHLARLAEEEALPAHAGAVRERLNVLQAI